MIIRDGKFVYDINQCDNSIDVFELQREDGTLTEDSSREVSSEEEGYERVDVGRLEIADDWLNNVEVKERYRRRGIASRMIRYAVEHLELQQIACVTESDAYEYSLTSDGESLIASCLRHRIITPDMCFFSTVSDVNPAGPEILSGDDDPGYDSGTVMAEVVALNPAAAPDEADLGSSDSDGIRAGTRRRPG